MSVNILFVCLGNICRSPAAEGAFIDLVQKQNVDGLNIDSAGTSAYHTGELADPRMREHALKRGLELTSRARQFVKEDFEKFDYILCMDQSNYTNVMKLDPEKNFKNKVYLFSHFCRFFSGKDVPDPYFGGAEGFEEVLDIVQDGSIGLLEHLKKAGLCGEK